MVAVALQAFLVGSAIDTVLIAEPALATSDAELRQTFASARVVRLESAEALERAEVGGQLEAAGKACRAGEVLALEVKTDAALEAFAQGAALYARAAETPEQFMDMAHCLVELGASDAFDSAFDDVAEPGAFRRQHHLGLEHALAAEPLLTYHPLDCLLRGNPHFFQEFSHRHVEALIIHVGLLEPPGMICQGSIAILRANDKGGHAGYEASHEKKVDEDRQDAAKGSGQAPRQFRSIIAGSALP